MCNKGSRALVLLLWLVPSLAAAQDYFSNPESAIYDLDRDRYFITNVGNGRIIEIDSQGDTSIYHTAYPWVLGTVIVGDTLFVTNQTRILGFDLITDALVYNVSIDGASDLNDIAADTSGNLYITGSSDQRVYKLDIASQTSSILASGMYWPNGILFDKVDNRLLMCAFGTNAPIRAISLDGSSISVLVSTPFTDLDGLTEDDGGNILVSSWGNNSIWRYDRNFSLPPELVSSGHSGPADIYYNIHTLELVVPNFNSNSVDFVPYHYSQFTRITEGPHVTDVDRAVGVSWADVNGDSYQDLLVSRLSVDDALYLNNGSGSFSKVISDVIVSDGGSNGCSAGDFDNDGDVDVYVTVGNHQLTPNRYYRNDGNGNYTRVTEDIAASDTGASVSAALADYDNDGFLDLYVADQGTMPPTVPCNNQLYRNLGAGQFEKVTEDVAVADPAHSNGACWADYDDDGDQDLFVLNWDAPNVLFRNEGLAFTRVTGLTFLDGLTASNFSWADYDNDGDLDLFEAVYTDGGRNSLHENIGGGSFVEVTGQDLVQDPGWTIGGSWGDFDNDGDLDLYISNSSPSHPDDPDYLYINDGSGNFTRLGGASIVVEPGVSASVAAADYDHDGDLDLFLSNGYNDNPCLLYTNNGNTNNWVNVRCRGVISNSSAIGARVRIRATIGSQSFWQMREISSRTGLSSQNSLNAHFGLGDATTIDSIKVEWPSGAIQVLTDVDVNQFLTIEEDCCSGLTGNVDYDPGGIVDIGDLTALIDFLFISYEEPFCMHEANVDGVQPVDIGDLTSLIDYLFISYTPPAECPEISLTRF